MSPLGGVEAKVTLTAPPVDVAIGPGV